METGIGQKLTPLQKKDQQMPFLQSMSASSVAKNSKPPPKGGGV